MVPRSIAVLFAVLLVATPTLSQTGQEKALITDNAGFEAGLTGWTADASYDLVEDANVAHSGSNCITGEVTQPDTHLTLARKFTLRPGAIYTLTVWARGTNNTKIAVWRTHVDGDRKNIGQWQNQKPQWRLNKEVFTVERPGEWTVDLIAPSSHGSPVGRVWVDDVQLTAVDVPEPVKISQGVGFNDYPSMARMGDSLIWAWISFRDGKDTLQVATTTLAGDVQETWEVASETYILRPYVTSDSDSACVVWAEELDQDWEITALPVTTEGPGTAIRVTKEAGVDIDPKATIAGDVTHIVWEASRRGGRQVRTATIRDGRASKATRISGEAQQAYDPSIAAPEGGLVTAVWTSYANGNIDLALSRLTGGKWGKPERLTTARTLDRHPALCASGGDLWLAWENANSKGYHVGNNSSRRVAVAKVTAEGLMSPIGLKTSALWQRAESASLAVDDVGRLWVAYLKPRSRVGWDLFFHAVTGDKISPPYRTSAMKGMDRPVSMSMHGDRILIASQGDTLPASWATSELAKEATTGSDALLSALELADAPAPAPIALEPYAEPDDVYEPGDLRVQRGEDRPTRTITYEGETLKLYYGDLHEHTDVSICNRTGDQSINESYTSMRDIARHDFACATDHGYNINAYLWNYTAKLARSNHDPGRFLTFLGEEWTSTFEEKSEKHPEGFYGHRNLVFEDPYWPWWYNARDRQTPKELWRQLAREDASVVTIPHQLADTGNVPCDWEQVNETAQPVAEIFQTRGSYEYDGAPRQAGRTLTGTFIQDAWAKGVVIGVIASPDHGGGYGKAAVFAPELSRKAILDAIRLRRTYGTTASKIFLDARVDGHLMGEKVSREGGGPVTVNVTVDCPQEIARIDVCRSNEFIYTREPMGKKAEKFTFQDTAPLDGPSYYYVRVIQTDEEIAWSSPVWLQ